MSRPSKVFRYPTASELQEANELGISVFCIPQWLPPLPEQPLVTKPDNQNPF
jgi:hypothetical protein